MTENEDEMKKQKNQASMKTQSEEQKMRPTSRHKTNTTQKNMLKKTRNHRFFFKKNP